MPSITSAAPVATISNYGNSFMYTQAPTVLIPSLSQQALRAYANTNTKSTSATSPTAQTLTSTSTANSKTSSTGTAGNSTSSARTSGTVTAARQRHFPGLNDFSSFIPGSTSYPSTSVPAPSTTLSAQRIYQAYAPNTNTSFGSYPTASTATAFQYQGTTPTASQRQNSYAPYSSATTLPQNTASSYASTYAMKVPTLGQKVPMGKTGSSNGNDGNALSLGNLSSLGDYTFDGLSSSSNFNPRVTSPFTGGLVTSPFDLLEAPNSGTLVTSPFEAFDAPSSGTHLVTSPFDAPSPGLSNSMLYWGGLSTSTNRYQKKT